MSKRVEIINSLYNRANEDARLIKSRHGQLEYITAMNYIHRYAEPGAKILEIGAGTGRYSIALAKEGYRVSAVELVEHNLAILQNNGKELKNLTSYQGDALNLGRFEDNAFDITLVFGPMYHLYEKADVNRALDEAIRVTKPDGVIFVAFLSVYAIMVNNYLNEKLAAGLEENFTSDYKIRHFEEQVFTGYDITEIEALFANKNTQYITTASMDSIIELAEERNDFSMSDADFDLYVKYHLAICEKRELLGSSSHILYICKKLN